MRSLAGDDPPRRDRRFDDDAVDSFDSPSRRSTNVIGTSETRQPRRAAT
jgi:hypothetical protein